MWLNIDELLEVMWEKLNLVRMYVVLTFPSLLGSQKLTIAAIPNPEDKLLITLHLSYYAEGDVQSRTSVMLSIRTFLNSSRTVS